MNLVQPSFWEQVLTVLASMLMGLAVLVSIGMIAYQRALYGDPPAPPSPAPGDYYSRWWAA